MLENLDLLVDFCGGEYAWLMTQENWALWMRLPHAWGNRSSFPTTSREPPIAPWLFGGLLSDERNKMLGTTSLRKGVEL